MLQAALAGSRHRSRVVEHTSGGKQSELLTLSMQFSLMPRVAYRLPLLASRAATRDSTDAILDTRLRTYGLWSRVDPVLRNEPVEPVVPNEPDEPVEPWQEAISKASAASSSARRARTSTPSTVTRP
eukprot:TRINITY_DN3730_c0_g1_i1.p3 TRINITY_DN3730_c0_g1~~TRINITY_DN3730_c0_g1_i1.p3  ORF type:complete len:127 (-),score=15.53 TRINITY_DN3730_c0_g1_i1:614-994(-)